MPQLIPSLSMRLLRDGIVPAQAVPDGVLLQPYPAIENALIAVGKTPDHAPGWLTALISSPDVSGLINVTDLYSASMFGLLFVLVNTRWFVFTFGYGHTQIDGNTIEYDFGLRVVLNAVDASRLTSADLRTPEENPIVRRTQPARRANQSAFSIDIERDIFIGLAGEPRDPSFARRVSGSDSLTVVRETAVEELEDLCDKALVLYSENSYLENFAWVDKIKGVRDKAIVDKLDKRLEQIINAMLADENLDDVRLAYPTIVDPDTPQQVRYKGLRSDNIFAELSFDDYLNEIRKRTTFFNADYLDRHRVVHVDSDGNPVGKDWRIRECIVAEVEIDSHVFVHNAGKWFQVDVDFAKELKVFFDGVERYTLLPAAEIDENEATYNARLGAKDYPDLLKLDKELLTPSGAVSTIETCDLLTKDGHLVHVKDEVSSSRLSHLFNQGVVSAQVLKLDKGFRANLNQTILRAQKAQGKKGFLKVIPIADRLLPEGSLKVVYAVLATGSKVNRNRLPFFSLITFRQAARALESAGFSYKFAWIPKPPSLSKPKPKKAAKLR